MILDEICPPAIIYIAFSLTHIVIDIFKKLYNTAFLKFVVMIIFTLLLNILCQQGLGCSLVDYCVCAICADDGDNNNAIVCF